MIRHRILAFVLALSVSTVSAVVAQKRRAKPIKWDAFPAGWTLTTKAGTFQTTLDKKELGKIVARIAELKPAYETHFGTKLKKGWRFVVLADRNEYVEFAKTTTKGRQNVQGQCFRAKRIVTVCNARRYGWLSTLSHEYAHAYYNCNGPIWLREGIASLVEVAEIKTKGKGKRQRVTMTIPVNPPRLRGLRIHQRGKHYMSIQNLVRGVKEPDGYGYSYEHGWSLHYFLFNRDAKKYRAFLKTVRKKTGRDISADVKKAFGLGLAELDKLWLEFTAKLRA